jgi:hypothetical protein
MEKRRVKVAYGVDDGRSSHMSSGAVWRYATLQAALTTVFGAVWADYTGITMEY